MDPHIYRYRIGSRGRDFFIGLSLSFAAAVLASVFYEDYFRNDDKVVAVFAVTWGGLTGLWTIFCGWAWWRSFLRIDRERIQLLRGPGNVIAEIPWDDVVELRLYGQDDVIITGAGNQIRVSEHFGNTGEAKSRTIRLAWPGIRAHLESEERERGVVTFRMPGRRLTGHMGYLSIVVVMAALTTVIVHSYFLDSHTHLESAGVAAFIWVSIIFVILMKLKGRAGWHSGWVTLSPGGILVHRLDGEKWLSWGTLTGAAWTEKGDLELHLMGGKSYRIPGRLGNVLLLEEFLLGALDRRRLET